MNKSEYSRYQAQGFTRIPVSSEIVADLDTPLSTFMKVGALPNTFLFESVHGGEKWGRYSIIGLPTRTTIEVHENTVSTRVDGEIVTSETVDDPLAWIESYQSSFSVPEVAGLPSVTGGLVGYFGYDTIRYIEKKLGVNRKPDPLKTPDILLMVSDELVIFDNLGGKLFVLVLAEASEGNGFERACERVAAIVQQLRKPLPAREFIHYGEVDESDFTSGYTEAGYTAAVEKIRQHIIDGDCMQVVLSQRLTIPFEYSALDLYRALRMLNPSPYLFYLNLGDHQIVGSSPEILVRVDNGEITVRPLAGTRPRGGTPDEDVRLEQELLADPKELAEHLMLIDLGRNDIGRVARTGTVKVTDKMSIERYSHVMHIVSNVVGQLREGVSCMDVLRATFPAGTLSGAPKVRAMELIQEMEPVKRGIYSGSIGYLSWNGNMDTAIAIRTAVIKDKLLNIQAGAGIVYDSIPQTEWDETMSKARAVFRAVQMVAAGIDRPLSEPEVDGSGAIGLSASLPDSLTDNDSQSDKERA